MLIQFTEILGFSIMIPVIPFLAKDLGLSNFEVGLLSSVFSFCQLFASPIIGKISDRYGRKPLLIFSQFTTMTGFILLGFSGYYGLIWLLVLARVVDGLLGSNMTVIQASLADISTPETRTAVFSISSGVFGAALILGPVLGGILSTVSPLGYALPMFIAAGISLISIVLVFTIFPETYINRPGKVTLRFNDIIPVKDMIRYSKTKNTRRSLLLFFFYTFGFFLFIRTFLLIAQIKFGIEADVAGYYHTTIGILRVLLQFLLVKWLIRTFGEKKILISGIISMIISMTAFAFITELFSIDVSDIGFQIAFAPIVFLAYGTGTARPVLSSRLTNTVGRKEYATILGINNSITSFTQIFAPLLGGLILDYLYSWIILALSAMSFTVILILLIIENGEGKQQEEITEIPSTSLDPSV
jgi:DHA1 family tetracycline resistance protein-like MFS transporter